MGGVRRGNEALRNDLAERNPEPPEWAAQRIPFVMRWFAFPFYPKIFFSLIVLLPMPIACFWQLLNAIKAAIIIYAEYLYLGINDNAKKYISDIFVVC